MDEPIDELINAINRMMNAIDELMNGPMDQWRTNPLVELYVRNQNPMNLQCKDGLLDT